MSGPYGAPQPMTGTEIVTIHQVQNGNLVKCSLTMNELLTWVQAAQQTTFETQMAAWLKSLPTAPPTSGAWLDNGVLSFVS